MLLVSIIVLALVVVPPFGIAAVMKYRHGPGWVAVMRGWPQGLQRASRYQGRHRRPKQTPSEVYTRDPYYGMLE